MKFSSEKRVSTMASEIRAIARHVLEYQFDFEGVSKMKSEENLSHGDTTTRCIIRRFVTRETCSPSTTSCTFQYFVFCARNFTWVILLLARLMALATLHNIKNLAAPSCKAMSFHLGQPSKTFHVTAPHVLLV